MRAGEEELGEMLKWFSPANPNQNHATARKIYQRGTGKWLVEGPKFRNWITTPNAGLWIHGIREFYSISVLAGETKLTEPEKRGEERPS